MRRIGKLLGMALIASATLAMPAAAVASPEYTEPKGVLLPVGADIVYTSTNFVVTNTALGTLECSQWTVRTELTQNSGSSVKEVGTGGETATCSASGLPLTITNPTIKTMSTNTFGSGTASMSFIADVGPFECQYEGSGGFTYGSNSDVVHMSGTTLRSVLPLCEPEEGSPEIHATFTRETPGGQAIYTS